MPCVVCPHVLQVQTRRLTAVLVAFILGGYC